MEEIIKTALLNTTRNKSISEKVIYFVSVGRLEKFRGKTMLTADLMSFDKADALGIAAWDDNEHCYALVTHDLHSFVIKDVFGLITKIRLG